MIARLRKVLPLLLSVPHMLLGLVVLILSLKLRGFYARIITGAAEAARAFDAAGLPLLVRVLWVLGICTALILLIGGLSTLLRRRPVSLHLFRAGCWAYYVIFLIYMLIVTKGVDTLWEDHVPYTGLELNRSDGFFLKMQFLGPAFLALGALIALHVLSRHRETARLFGATPAGPPAAAGGEAGGVLEYASAAPRFKTRDPVATSSMGFSILVHVLVIFILPIFMGLRSCRTDAYNIPGGGGGGGGGGAPKVEVIKVKKREPTKRKKLITRPNSAISFAFPDIDDSKMQQELEQETLNTYVANQNIDQIDQSTQSGFGQGPGDGSIGSGGGKGGGFFGGSKDGVVRFIRIQYDGVGWDDGMSDGERADGNFLEEFHKVSKFKTAAKGEAIPIVGLHQFKPGSAPPFLFFTGNGRISNITANEIKILRDYLNSGGMLFADAGAPEWDADFRNLMRQVFPDKGLIDIANDDPIYQYPFRFPNGAPPLWHHGGNRAMGVKLGSRWAVFYHPGDMNDAWKTGHSGARPQVAKQSINLGMNVVVYSYIQYIEATKSLPKK